MIPIVGNCSVNFIVGKFGGSENSSYLCVRNDIKGTAMCNYNIAIDEAVMKEVRPSITEGMEENAWVQLQVEMLFSRMAAKAKMVKPHQQMLSQRLRGIAHAPKDFDYKKELEERF